MVSVVQSTTDTLAPYIHLANSLSCLRSLLIYHLHKEPFTTILSPYKDAHPLFPIISFSQHLPLLSHSSSIWSNEKGIILYSSLSLMPVPNLSASHFHLQNALSKCSLVSISAVVMLSSYQHHCFRLPQYPLTGAPVTTSIPTYSIFFIIVIIIFF